MEEFNYKDYEDVIIYLCYSHYMDNNYDDEIPDDGETMRNYLKYLNPIVKRFKINKTYCFTENKK